MPKPLTIRLSADQLEQIETISRIDGVAIAEEIREAVDLLLADRRGDEAFRQRVAESFARARQLISSDDESAGIAEALGDPVADVVELVHEPADVRAVSEGVLA